MRNFNFQMKGPIDSAATEVTLLVEFGFALQDKKYLIISAADSPKQDLMQYVSHCNDFIHAARLRGGHVLVHW